MVFTRCYSSLNSLRITLTEEEVVRLLALYREDIRLVLSLFQQRFGPGNPVHAWRQGRLDRVGHLDGEQTMEYSLHGGGCTVELPGATCVSFDWEDTSTPSFDPFKFQVYVESRGVEARLPAENELYALAGRTYFPSQKG